MIRLLNLFFSNWLFNFSISAFICSIAAFNKESFGEFLNVSAGSEMEQDTIMLEKLGVRKRADRPVHVKEPYGTAGNNCISRAEVYTALAGIMEMRGNAAKEIPDDAEVHPVH